MENKKNNSDFEEIYLKPKYEWEYNAAGDGTLYVTLETPISGPSGTHSNAMRNTDASSYQDLSPRYQINEKEIPDDGVHTPLTTPERDVPGPSGTNDTRRTNVSISFEDLILEVFNSLNTVGYEHPSEIQTECFPQAISGHDILPQAGSKWEINQPGVIIPLYTPKAPISRPSGTQSNHMRSSDASGYKDLLPRNQINVEETILPGDGVHALLTTSERDVPGPSGTNDTGRTNVPSFKDLFLKPDIIKSLNTCGYVLPSEFQTKCIPQAISGHDILAQAQSGTGKTIAFILSTLHLLEATKNRVQTLVICPTRELANQTAKQYERLSKHLPGTRIATFTGGFRIKKDKKLLSIYFPHIIVGTAGRILSLIRSKDLDVQHLKHFVLEECDQMLQEPVPSTQIHEIYLSLPKKKQVLMFSAMLRQEIREHGKIYMRNPIEIYMDDNDGLRMRGMVQHYVCLKQESKFKKLVQLLKSLQYNQMVIFSNTVSGCTDLESSLVMNNTNCIGIHRHWNQQLRLERYEEFQNGEKKILVVPKDFGRGIDFGGVNIVINYDMPTDPDTYLHCVVLARRFDTMGRAITFLVNEEDVRVMKEVLARFQVTISELLLS